MTWCFPRSATASREMSDNTMRRAIFKLGYDGTVEGKSKAVPHGFRATASSILNETGFNPDAIERQLGSQGEQQCPGCLHIPCPVSQRAQDDDAVVGRLPGRDESDRKGHSHLLPGSQ